MALKLSTSSRTGKQEETNCSAARLGFQEVGELFLKKQQRQQDASFDVLPEDVRGNSNEWMALVEPGVLITFTSLPGGLNHLKRIRFRQPLSLSRSLFLSLRSWLGFQQGDVRQVAGAEMVGRELRPRDGALQRAELQSTGPPISASPGKRGD